MNAISTPTELDPYADEYRDRAWEEYTLAELGQFVHLLAKRATHRADADKRAKDLLDARNYLRMMEARLDALDEASVGEASVR